VALDFCTLDQCPIATPALEIMRTQPERAPEITRAIALAKLTFANALALHACAVSEQPVDLSEGEREFARLTMAEVCPDQAVLLEYPELVNMAYACVSQQLVSGTCTHELSPGSVLSDHA
jgi:hypothetical protein